jgi:tRNA nucleotidyltransferase (CCA-adding enzyme)
LRLSKRVENRGRASLTVAPIGLRLAQTSRGRETEMSPPSKIADAVPTKVVALCRTLRDAGYATYLVGGSIRDLLIGRSAKDWDVATSALPEEVMALFRKTIPTGIKHGTVTVLLGKLPVEVTTFRGDGAYVDGRRPEEVTFVSTIEDDLSRRDFTINAIAFDPLKNEIIDPFAGQQDLKTRLVRAVGDPLKRFSEDGLRVMRAIRFAAVLEFSLDPATQAAISPTIEVFRRVSWERIRDELLKMLMAPVPSAGLKVMVDTGLMAEVIPEMLPAVGLVQNEHHSHDVFEHTLMVCDRCQGDAVLSLAALLHDIGKPETAVPRTDNPRFNSFHGHERKGAEICETIASRLKLSNTESQRLCHLVRHHFFATQPLSDAAMRRFVRRVGEDCLEDLLILRRADLSGRDGGAQRLDELGVFAEHLRKVLAAAPPLNAKALAISGHQVMARVGKGPGRYVGEYLASLLERVLDDPALNEEETLLKLVDELAQSQ